MTEIKPVVSKAQLKAFIDFPHELYRDDPNYVPELFIAQRDLLSRHPFHLHSSIAPFLAYKDGRIAGRIAAIWNNNHNTFNRTKDGFFGFLDMVDDPEVAAALLDTAAAHLREKGAEMLLGPVNPSTNETCGMLIDGFDAPAVAMMTYNKPYYSRHIETLGFRKKTDLLAYQIKAETFDDKPLRLLEALTARLKGRGITIRTANMKNFRQEVAGLKEVYNGAWDKNLGFVPMTDEEFHYMAKDLKLVIDPDFCLVAEHEGKMVGFALCIPDINQVLIRIKKGRLLPTGIFKLLLLRKKISTIRVIALGVLEPYRKMGIEAVFYGRIIRRGLQKKITTAEASWILEDNVLMNRGMANVNGQVYKRYRIYEKELNGRMS